MEERNCVIIHGCPSKNEKTMDPETRTYDKHWMPWLKSKLESKGIKTETPLMSTPWKPDYEDWKKEIEKSEINENTILIGHSCGGGFLVRWLGDTSKKIKKLILVAPAILHSNEWKPLEKLLRFEIKNLIKNNIGTIVIFVSEDDSKGILKSVEIFSKHLGAEIIKFKEKGHFTLGDMGTEEFPELLEEVLKDK